MSDVRQQLEDKINLSVESEELKELLLSGIAIDSALVMEHTDDSNSYYGGLPRLDEEQQWPLAPNGSVQDLVASIDLGELPASELPDEGYLNFFWPSESEGFGVAEMLGGVVLLSSDDADPRDHPTGEEYAPLCLLAAERAVCDYTPLFNLKDQIEDAISENDELIDDVLELLTELSETADQLSHTSPLHQLLGVARPIQGPVLAEIRYLLADAEREGAEVPLSCAPSAERADTPTSVSFDPEEWCLLAQFDSDSNLMFGDAGVVYFLISKEGLQAGDFSRVLTDMQCC